MSDAGRFEVWRLNSLILAGDRRHLAPRNRLLSDLPGAKTNETVCSIVRRYGCDIERVFGPIRRSIILSGSILFELGDLLLPIPLRLSRRTGSGLGPMASLRPQTNCRVCFKEAPVLGTETSRTGSFE